MTTFSLVVPIYNEEENIPELTRRLRQLMKDLPEESEVVFVDDGSTDRSLAMLRDLHEEDSRFRYLSFARNFGHQVAVTAGLHHTRGAAVLVLDADLQDPPELIPEMAQRWREGNQVVYAHRVSRQREGILKRSMAFVFYRILRSLSDVEIPTDTGDFCLMDRRVVDLLNQMPERSRYIRGLRSWVGFRQTAVHFERPPRFAGEVKYTFRKSLGLAIDGAVGFSRRPLRIATWLGVCAAVMALGMAALIVLWRLFQPGSPVIGFALIATAVFFLAAVQLLCIGILGEYIGRIYEEVKGRPLYTVKEVGGYMRASSETAGSPTPETLQRVAGPNRI